MENLALENNKEINNNINIEKEQKNFLQTNLGQAIDTGLNFGLKVVLPDCIENQVIDVKDALLNSGFKEASQTAIDNAINIGKSLMGIVTGNFENALQIKTAVQKGGLIDGISNIFDVAIDWAKNEKYISSSLAKKIKKGKKEIINNIKGGIENSLDNQVESVEKINNYINKWEQFYNDKDFTNMEKQYKNIKSQLEKIVPLENIINKAREVEMKHNLIKNNGRNFQITEEENALIKLLN